MSFSDREYLTRPFCILIFYLLKDSENLLVIILTFDQKVVEVIQ